MADKQALFSGRSGGSSKGRPNPSPLPRRPKVQDEPPPPPPPPPTGERSSRSPPTYGRGAGSKGVAATAERRKMQLKEAEDNRKAANKYLQKTMTRWNPNYFSAAALFEKAATCYRAAGEENQALAMFITAGECQSHESVAAPASAAKDFREAALITERQGREDEAAALYLRCAEAWVHADEAGRAAEYLGRSAKLVESEDEDAAAERYIYASKVMVPQGSDVTTNFVRVVSGVEILVQGIKFLASVNRLDQCMEVVERYCVILQAECMEHSLHRMYLTSCVLALARGDYVKADAAFRDLHLQNTAYLHSEECRLEEDLLTAFKNFDPNLLHQAQTDRTLRRLEVPIVKLAKSLRIEGDQDEMFASDNKPSGTLGDVRARVGALQEKNRKPSSSPSSSTVGAASSTSTRDTHLRAPPERSGGVAAGTSRRGRAPPAVSNLPPGSAPRARKAGEEEQQEEEEEDNDEDDVNSAEKNALFGAAPVKVRTASASAGKSTPPADGTFGKPTAAEQRGFDDDVAGDDLGLDLGDLESSLGVPDQAGGAGGGDDDLEAMIEAARMEAEALGGLGGVGGGGGAADGGMKDDEDDDEEDGDDDMDLT